MATGATAIPMPPTYFPGAQNQPAADDSDRCSVTAWSAGWTASAAAPPTPRITHVDLRRGKLLKSFHVSWASAPNPVCSGSGGGAADCAAGCAAAGLATTGASWARAADALVIRRT